jgi:hypothetical protein
MPASKAEQVLDALKALLETLPGAAVDRNRVLPEKIPAGGLIVLRDGDPGEPEQALGGFGSAAGPAWTRRTWMSQGSTGGAATWCPARSRCARRWRSSSRPTCST